MSKVLISIALLVVVCSAQLSVNLTPTPITDANKKTTDFVYTFKGDDKKNVLFNTKDTTDYYSSTSSDNSPKSLQIQLGNGEEDKTGKLDFTGRANDASKLGQVDYTIGLQIAAEGSPYLSSRISSKFRLQSQSFSFLFNEKVNKIFFGQPQSYLTEKLLSFPLYHTQTGAVTPNTWALEVSQVYLSKQNLPLNQGAPSAYAAVFDSTTATITVDPETYAKTFAGLSISLNGNTVTSDCTSNLKSDDDALVFVFKGNSDTKNNKFSVKTRDLFIKQDDGTCVFLLRQTAAVTKGQTANWILGTTFLKNVYTYFDYSNYQISLGNIQSLKIQNKNINQTWSTVFIIAGLLLAIASLAILTALIKPITWVPEAPKQKVQPQPQVVPQKVIIYQQPAQQVVYTQPLGYSNIAQSLSGGSPTRVYQQAPFQSVYRQ